MPNKITFKFIVSGDDAEYSIVNYGNPDLNMKRVTVKRHVPPAETWLNGDRRFNYQHEDYVKYFVDVAGMMGWYRQTPIPWEVIEAFRNWQQENHARAVAKYPDLDLEPLQLIRGRYYYDAGEKKLVIDLWEDRSG